MLLCRVVPFCVLSLPYQYLTPITSLTTPTSTRKKLLLANHLTIPLELRLLDLIFTVPRNIKSSVPWHHRRWLLQIPGAPTPPLFNHEIALCHRAATLYPRNYYAWNHRHWIVRELIMVGDLRALRAEYDAMRAWVATNVSDHSGVQHMERCLVAIMQVDKGEEEVSTVVREHVEWVRGLVEGYPGHETMWCHLRFCTELEREIGERMGVEMEVAFARRCRVKEVGVGDDHEATERQRRLACAYELWVLRLVRLLVVLSLTTDCLILHQEFPSTFTFCLNL